MHIALAAFVIAQAASTAVEPPANPPPSDAAKSSAVESSSQGNDGTTTGTGSHSATPVLPPPKGPRLLVMDLVDKGAGAEVVSAINQAVQGQAVQSHLGETVTSTQIKIALDAAANQALLGCESEACMTDIGKTVEAAVILGGSVAKVGGDYLITVLAVNPRDGSRLAQVQRKVPSNRELYYYAARQLTSLALTGRTVDPRVPVVIRVPAGPADVIVDGKPAGTAEETSITDDGRTVTVKLDPGSHELRVKKSGKAEWKTIVVVEEAAPLEVTAALVDDRVELWPVALATGGATIVTGAVALAFGLAAQDTFNGSVDLPGYDRKPENSYAFVTPVDSAELFRLQQDIDRNALAANILYATTGVLAAATIGLIATDLVLGATAE